VPHFVGGPFFFWVMSVVLSLTFVVYPTFLLRLSNCEAES
jgi:hypothetical protein